MNRRIVADHDDVSAVRRRRLDRERRPNDRPSRRAERKGEDNAENDSFHILVFICSIRATEIWGKPFAVGSVHERPIGNEHGSKAGQQITAGGFRALRVGRFRLAALESNAGENEEVEIDIAPATRPGPMATRSVFTSTKRRG